MIGRGPKRPPLLESAPQAPVVLFRSRNLKHKALTNLRKQLVWQSLLIYLLLLGKALPRLPTPTIIKSYRLCARLLDTLRSDLEYLDP
jgi:hypothetical protein